MPEKLTLHIVARFGDGLLSLAKVGGTDGQDTFWITYAGRGKYMIRRQPRAGKQDQTVTDWFKEDFFDSPEAALQALEKSLGGADLPSW